MHGIVWFCFTVIALSSLAPVTYAVVCVKFCKKYFRKSQFLSVDRRRACGNVGKLNVLGEAFPSLRGNPRLVADFL